MNQDVTNPFYISQELEETYFRYLLTQFPFGKRDKNIRKKMRELFYNERETLVKGPYIEVSPTYESSISIDELAKGDKTWKPIADYLSKKDHKRNTQPLYKHQILALQASKDKNYIVATGTGSGKTESFIYPIVNYCLKNKGEGVRALIIYPLNALVEDQIERLANLLDGSGITFGRYTGQTPKRTDDLKVVPVPKCKEHLIYREDFRETPPNILITNYAMLEYLLLRPGDSKIFNQFDEHNYKYLILDEAHTYSGTIGTEIANLIKRLRSRINKKPSEIIHIATSATLGDFDRAKIFAERLFGSKFYDGSIISGKREKLADGLDKNNLELKHNLQQIKEWNYPSIELSLREVEENFNLKNLNPDSDPYEVIYNIFQKDRLFVEFSKILDDSITDINSIASHLFPSEYAQDSKKCTECLRKYIAWISTAKKNKKLLLPAKYHLFISATKGLYCYFDSKSPGIKTFSLNQKKKGLEQPFELAVCKACGEPYIVGVVVNEKGRDKYKPITDSFFESLDSEDEEVRKIVLSFKPDATSKPVWIDPNTSLIHYHEQLNTVQFHMIEDCLLKSDSYETSLLMKNCLNCNEGRGGSGSMLRCLRFSQHSSIPPLSSKFFEYAPTLDRGDNKPNERTISGGRKMLIFSDSRQEAAFFGPYLQVSHNQLIISKKIIDIISSLENEINFITLVSKITDQFIIASKDPNNYAIFLDDVKYVDEDKNSAVERETITKRIIFALYKLISEEGLRISGLEGLGLAGIRVNETFESKLPLTQDQCNTITQIMVRYLMFRSVLPKQVTIKSNEKYVLDQEDAYYGQYFDKSLVIRSEDKDKSQNKYVIVFSDSKSETAVIKLLAKFLKSWIPSINQADILTFTEELFNFFIKSELIIPDYETSHNEYKVNVKKLFIDPKATFHACKSCGRLTWLDSPICIYPECRGQYLNSTESNQLDNEFNHYRNYFTSKQSFPELRAVEHTAQIDKVETAPAYQNKFKNGEINVISSSTTFEMGIDLGELNFIFLRNMPPSVSSYIQRAGRAGRRQNSISFILTYCKNLPHDQFYFFNPEERLLNADSTPPAIVLDNIKITERHIASIIISLFFQEFTDILFTKQNRYLKDPKCFSFFESTINNVNTTTYFLDIWLKTNRDLLKKKINEILENSDGQLISKHILVDIADKAIDRLLKDAKYSISQYKEDYTEELNYLESLRIKASENQQYRLAETHKKRVQDLRNTQLISGLSSRGILPSYAFPTDVISLRILNNNFPDLSRPLQRAITEYAPEAEVVSNARVFKSKGVWKYPSQEFKLFYYIYCKDCRYFYRSYKRENVAEKIQYHKSICSVDINTFNMAIYPKWGFYVPTSERPKKIYLNTHPNKGGYSSDYLFNEAEFDKSSKTIYLENGVLKLGFSNGFDIALINEGKLTGKSDKKKENFRICPKCGLNILETQLDKAHKDYNGKRCSYIVRRIEPPQHLIGFLDTDVIKISFNNVEEYLPEKLNNYLFRSFWRTALYTFIEAISRILNIQRDDLDGIYVKENQDNNMASLIIFDAVPGGAGHVARLFGDAGEEPQLLMTNIIQEALKILNCQHCLPESACYSCLYHYSNQKVQHSLNKGFVKDWFEKLSKRKT